MLKISFFIFFNFTLLRLYEAHENCGSLVRSTCSPEVTTKWNKQSIGPSLKKWVESLTKITSMTEQDKDYIYLRKKFKEFERKNNAKSIIQYISNVDCETKKSIGPTWIKPGVFSDKLFDDGFLYGMEDEKGEMTGNLNIK